MSVSSAGDVNGDGYSDVIVGAYGNDAVGLMQEELMFISGKLHE
ncbi:MAG: FG-GAP repeat protein [Ignavibacteria bacterium]|nr:FG-GAP repeat protein [Ignavibacteria bacterium]